MLAGTRMGNAFLRQILRFDKPVSRLPQNKSEATMNSYQHAENRRKTIVGATVILIGITLLSCVSSFSIYRQGFQDFPAWLQNLLGLVAVLAVEGCFVWLLHGYRASFSSHL